ncbi:MAG: hypothetical protein COA42_03180 [Alteromonadaceae bacterium]|nr:MAG: hypothetical protein COA42_03180 [Alteromonadaceae bacterium]
MQTKSYAELVQELAQDYYNYRITFDVYRQQRRELLRSIDQHFNAKPATKLDAESVDVTVPRKRL